MLERLNELYLLWLIPQIHTHPRSKSFDVLIAALHSKEFVWRVANDDNRIADGLELRYHFLTDESLRLEFATFGKGLETTIGHFRNQPCSVFEVIIGLSRRLAFASGQEEPGWWAWRLICNLDLDEYSDPMTVQQIEEINDVLETLIWRTYHNDGQGGFFPLQYPPADQTKVEIWDQMNAYIAEYHS